MQHTHQPMPLDTILREAWQAVKGAKLPSFVAFFTLIITQLVIYFVSVALVRVIGDNWINDALHLLLSAIFVAPLLTGLLMIGVQRFRAPPVPWSLGLQYYRMIPRLFIAFFVGVLLLWIIFTVISLAILFLLMLLHVNYQFHYQFSWTLFCSIAFMVLIFALYKSFLLFNFILVADQGVNPFIAWWKSCKMVGPHYGKVLLALIYMLIFNILGLCLLGVGLIWTIPWSYLVIGKMYLFCQQDREHPNLIVE